MDEISIPADVSYAYVAEAEEIMRKKYGTKPVKLSVSETDRTWLELHFCDRPWSVDPDLSDHAWYIEDAAGHRVGSS